MEKNPKVGKPNQGTPDNKSNQKTNQDYSKKQTDPNSPVANHEKHSAGKIMNDKPKESSMNHDKTKPDAKGNGQTPKDKKESFGTGNTNSKHDNNKPANKPASK